MNQNTVRLQCCATITQEDTDEQNFSPPSLPPNLWPTDDSVMKKIIHIGETLLYTKDGHTCQDKVPHKIIEDDGVMRVQFLSQGG